MRRHKRLFLIIGLILIPIVLCSGILMVVTAAVAKRGSVLRVTEKDPRLQKAAEAAQATLPKFLDRLKHPDAGDQFAVKVRFKTAVGPEYLWLKSPKSVGAKYSGILDQKPIAVAAAKGDKLEFDRSDIYDWLVKRRDGSMAGGFTDIVLSQ